MKKGMSNIVFVLDRSGSMETMRNEAIGGFNAFVEDQKKEPGEAVLTLIQFDNQYEVVFSNVPIQDVKPLTKETYQPRSTTALYDAIGKAIHDLGLVLDATPEPERPEHVIFVVMTDGMENASKEYPGAKVQEMIKHQEDVYSWNFRYLAAGVDAEQAVTFLSSNPNVQVCSFNATGKDLSAGFTKSSSCVRSLRRGSSSSGWNQ